MNRMISSNEIESQAEELRRERRHGPGGWQDDACFFCRILCVDCSRLFVVPQKVLEGVPPVGVDVDVLHRCLQ